MSDETIEVVMDPYSDECSVRGCRIRAVPDEYFCDDHLEGSTPEMHGWARVLSLSSLSDAYRGEDDEA